MKLSHVLAVLLIARSLTAAQPTPDAAQPAPDAAQPAPDAPRSAAGRDDTGFFLASADGTSRLRLGGYMQFDGRYFAGDGADALTNQFAFRSIRPELRGTLFDRYDFRLLPDFAGGRIVIQEAYVDLRVADAIRIRFGKYKVPFGLERLQPEIATTFVERGLPTLLAPNRDLGVQVHGVLARGVLAYQLGVFDGVADNASVDTDTSDHKELVARAFVTPLATGDPLVRTLGVGGAVMVGYEHGTLAQTGLGAWLTQGQTTFFQYRTGTTLATSPIADGRHVRATAHASWYTGPFGVMAEYARSSQRAGIADRPPALVTADAWQVLGQWVISGGSSTFEGVVPTDRRFGAFDVAARVGGIRLRNDDAFTAGLADPARSARKALSAGGGADWLPNRSLRFALDLERTWFTGGAQTGNRQAETSIVGRVQTVF